MFSGWTLGPRTKWRIASFCERRALSSGCIYFQVWNQSEDGKLEAKLNVTFRIDRSIGKGDQCQDSQTQCKACAEPPTQEIRLFRERGLVRQTRRAQLTASFALLLVLGLLNLFFVFPFLPQTLIHFLAAPLITGPLLALVRRDR